MKKTNIATVAALALAGAAMVAGSASAQTALSYNTGDLFLGIRATGGTGSTKDLLIDLGSAATYRDATAVMTLSLGNLSQDLADTFGASWNTRSDLVWGVFGAVGTTALNGDVAKTLYVSKSVDGGSAYVGGGVQATAWNSSGGTAAGTITGRMIAVGQAYAKTAGVTNLSTANSSVTLVQNLATDVANNIYPDVNNYTQYATGPTGISFGYYNPTIEAQLGINLDVFRMPVTYGASGIFEGNFSMANDATVSFVPEGVPEPSSIAFLGMGAALLWSGRRQRKSVQA